MDRDELLRGAQTYLEWLGGEAVEVRQNLGDVTMREVVQRLADFGNRAQQIATERDLLQVASDVQTWVETTPALRVLLVEPGADVAERQRTRVISLDQEECAAKSAGVQEAAEQLGNHLATCREALEEALVTPATEEPPSDERPRDE